MMRLIGMVRAESVHRVQLISCLLAETLTSEGRDVLVAVPQFDPIVDLLFQVFHRYTLVIMVQSFTEGVPWWHPHRRQELATLPSV